MNIIKAFLEPDGVAPAAQTETTPQTNQTAPEETPKYTDKQVNDLIAKEASKRQEKATADLLLKMGFKTLEDVDAFNKSRQESMTQAEKDKLAIQEKETAAQTASRERDEARAELSAMKAGVPADKVAKVVKLAAGYDGDTMDEKISALLADFPDFVKAQTAAPQNAGRVTGQQGMSDEERLLAVARKQAGLTK
jgi:hypothetical protein